jgi:hypothetical protein
MLRHGEDGQREPPEEGAAQEAAERLVTGRQVIIASRWGGNPRVRHTIVGETCSLRAGFAEGGGML